MSKIFKSVLILLVSMQSAMASESIWIVSKDKYFDTISSMQSVTVNCETIKQMERSVNKIKKKYLAISVESDAFVGFRKEHVKGVFAFKDGGKYTATGRLETMYQAKFTLVTIPSSQKQEQAAALTKINKEMLYRDSVYIEIYDDMEQLKYSADINLSGYADNALHVVDKCFMKR